MHTIHLFTLTFRKGPAYERKNNNTCILSSDIWHFCFNFIQSNHFINDNLNMYINDHLRMYTSDYALI